MVQLTTTKEKSIEQEICELKEYLDQVNYRRTKDSAAFLRKIGK